MLLKGRQTNVNLSMKIQRDGGRRRARLLPPSSAPLAISRPVDDSGNRKHPQFGAGVGEGHPGGIRLSG